MLELNMGLSPPNKYNTQTHATHTLTHLTLVRNDLGNCARFLLPFIQQYEYL